MNNNLYELFNNDKIRGGGRIIEKQRHKAAFHPFYHLKSPKGVYQLHPLLRSVGWLWSDTYQPVQA